MAAPVVAPSRPEVAGGVPRVLPGWIDRVAGADHKSVARLYLGGSVTFLVITLIAFALMRAQLIIPDNTLISPDVFGQLLSTAGITLILLFALPLILGIIGYIVPLQIGARTVAFPRLNLFSAWLYLFGAAAIYLSFLYTPPESGVLALTPLSSSFYTPSHGVDAWIIGVGMVTLGLTLFALNMLVTLLTRRAPGMAWRRAPLFTLSAAAICWILLIVGPVMLAALTMLNIDRNFEGTFFVAGEGGSPMLYQHLAYIFTTGLYASVVLFAAGVISEIIPTFTGRRLFNRRAAAGALIWFAILAPLAWMQNMYTSPISVGWSYFAMVIALALVIPVGVLVYSWLRTLWGASISTKLPLLFALAALSTLIIGLAGELMWSVLPVGWQYANTTASQGDTIYVFVGGAVLAGSAALHYWMPKISGRVAAEGLSKASLALILIGVHLYAIPMFFAGLAGQPVDVYRFFEGQGLDGYNLTASIGAFVLVVGVILELSSLARGFSSGRKVGPDPWGGTTLEWLALSPPTANNFDAVPDVRSDEPLSDIREAVRQRHGRVS